MSDDSEYEIAVHKKLKKTKQKPHKLTDSSLDNSSSTPPKNTQKTPSKTKQNPQQIPTAKIKSKPLTTNKSGTLFDYFKAKRETIKQQTEEENVYPVKKKIELEQEQEQQEQQEQQQQEEEEQQQEQQQQQSDENEIIEDQLEPIVSAKLPNTLPALESYLSTINNKIKQEQANFFKEQYELSTKPLKAISDQCIPLCGNVTEFDFDTLAQTQLHHGGRLFDVIMMDPPWQLASAQPSRGVAIQYKQLSDEQIKAMPVEKLQDQGFIFVWAINAKYSFACSLVEKWGYKVVDEITWVKKTVNGKVAPSHGFYLQHAKESCIIGVKGNVDKICNKGIACDVIVSKRRGQSQKPEEIYQLVEEFVPSGYYLEIFGRRNNLRDKWVTLGNEL